MFFVENKAMTSAVSKRIGDLKVAKSWAIFLGNNSKRELGTPTKIIEEVTKDEDHGIIEEYCSFPLLCLDP